MRKGERRKQELVDRASDLFFQHGYENTSLQDILDAVGCSKGSFYHHFETKMDLLMEIARQHVQAGHEAFLAETLRNPLDALDRLLYHACPFRKGEEGFVRSLVQLMRSRESAALEQAIWQATDALYYHDFLKCVTLAEEEGLGTGEAERCLVWHGYLTATLLIIRQADHFPPETATARVVALMRALRRQMESSLCLSYGALVIMEPEEMVLVLETALASPGSLA